VVAFNAYINITIVIGIGLLYIPLWYLIPDKEFVDGFKTVLAVAQIAIIMGTIWYADRR